MKKPVPALIPFLVFVSLVFIGILIYTYVETRRANPQMIEVGRAEDCGIGSEPAIPASSPAFVFQTAYAGLEAGMAAREGGSTAAALRFVRAA